MKHRTRRILTVTVALLLISGLAACSASPEERIGEIIDGIADGATSTTPRSTTEEAESTTEAEDEPERTSENDEPGMDWPSDRLPREIPEPDGSTTTSMMQINEGVIVSVRGLSEEDAKDYIEQLEKEGWEIETEMTMNGVIMIGAVMDDGSNLSFTWQSEEDATIVYEPGS